MTHDEFIQSIAHLPVEERCVRLAEEMARITREMVQEMRAARRELDTIYGVDSDLLDQAEQLLDE